MQSNLIIDFDSTLVRVETLEELANIALINAADRKQRIEQIKAICKDGMEGKIAFSDSLCQRLNLFSASRQDLEELTDLLINSVTPSVANEAAFIRDNREHIYIISGGFKELIVPVTSTLGLLEDHVLANTFVWEQGRIAGVDTSNPLSQEGGKEKKVQELDLARPVIMVGDGYSDYLVRKAGEADQFIAFTENVHRNSVVLRADTVAKNFHEVVREIKRLDPAAERPELVEATD